MINILFNILNFYLLLNISDAQKSTAKPIPKPTAKPSSFRPTDKPSSFIPTVLSPTAAPTNQNTSWNEITNENKENINIVALGTIVGSFPSAAMLVSSFLLSSLTISSTVEAMFQNFAAGLILAAVGSELFPLVSENTSEADSIIGLTVGFPLALLFIFVVEYLIDSTSNLDEDSANDIIPNCLQGWSSIPSRAAELTGLNGIMLTTYNKIWEEESVKNSCEAISNPVHKNHIKEHLEEIYESIQKMEQKANDLVWKEHSTEEAQGIAEFIDEEIHGLQYKLDHSRRLLQGAETGHQNDKNLSWVNNERKESMLNKLQILKQSAQHLLDHFHSDEFNLDIIQELHAHMDEMDEYLDQFHDSVAQSFSRWRRSRPMLIPEIGAKVPISLILPVIIDSMVDGFLIGVSCALNPKAGYILAAANVLEMSFLGMALAVRISKCTGSTQFTRTSCIISPPVLMLLFSTLGAWVGASVISLPILFVILVSFGIVALLFLVCNELLIEAKHIQGDDNNWLITGMIFLGVYFVLLLNRLIPG